MKTTEITLSTGKKVVTKEGTGFTRFKMTEFLTAPMADANGRMTAGYFEQLSFLKAIFSVSEVNGEAVKQPKDQASFVKALSTFTDEELEEFVNRYSELSEEDEAGNDPVSTAGNSTDGSMNALASD
ncbi:hypothetical protein CIG75_12755 [Tumebacillus algifaecis]|uniref:Uncharacterized protein n=1 Tax=Tumebacillus algifaecis TaxID=1214604 RepID=A0A223D243_9BACL|nr:hypothetical protein [Tumebacillus algifaecis]ASS75769.1 hypothetical protein CIG75_12755 [Tumebacillus algifaecis]